MACAAADSAREPTSEGWCDIIRRAWIGNRLRYETSYLYLVIVFSAATSLTAMLSTDYWLDNPLVFLLLLGVLVVILAYLRTLLRIRALRRTIDAAERAIEAKSRFLAQISHELRTPLNGIVGMSEMLDATTLSPEQRERFEVLQASARSLQSMVENVLDISALEAGKLERNDADFRLSQLLKDSHLMLRPSAHAKGLAFELNVSKQIPDMLHGDCAVLRQVLNNLLSNAIKFTERGKVSLDVVLHEIDEAQVWIRFSVHDTGIGIPAEALERIFDAFEQADSSRTRDYEGAGLGTSIAKVLTELLGGHIRVGSRVGAGSHFWILVPFGLVEPDDSAARPAPAQAVPAPAKMEPAPAQAGVTSGDRHAHHRAHVRPMRILVVDDQLSNRMVASHHLEKAGHRPQTADNGAAALDAIQQQHFDAVLLDLRMPGLDGIEVMQRAGVMQAGRERTPFIILTGDTTPGTVFECERAGAFAVLSKPLVAERLLEKLAEIATGGQEQAPGPSAVMGVDGGALISWAVVDDLNKLGEHFIPYFFGESVRDVRKCIADLELAGETAHWLAFRDGCHGLKSAASCMGAVRLAQAASDTLRLTDWQLPEQWRGRVERLRQLLEATIDALRQRGQDIRFEGDLKF